MNFYLHCAEGVPALHVYNGGGVCEGVRVCVCATFLFSTQP